MNTFNVLTFIQVRTDSFDYLKSTKSARFLTCFKVSKKCYLMYC